jgi:hypothetical protein
VFDTKVCKQCKYVSHKYSGRLPKYVEFDADFKSCEKLAKGLPKKVKRAENFEHNNKRRKTT